MATAQDCSNSIMVDGDLDGSGIDGVGGGADGTTHGVMRLKTTELRMLP